MTLIEEFKNEIKLKATVEDGSGNSFYREEYVEWLEDKILMKNLKIKISH